MTGLGALKKLRSNNIEVVSFIDSDPAFQDILVNGLPVRTIGEVAEELRASDDAAILVAVEIGRAHV